jgi:hypothetical protein
MEAYTVSSSTNPTTRTARTIWKRQPNDWPSWVKLLFLEMRKQAIRRERGSGRSSRHMSSDVKVSISEAGRLSSRNSAGQSFLTWPLKPHAKPSSCLNDYDRIIQSRGIALPPGDDIGMRKGFAQKSLELNPSYGKGPPFVSGLSPFTTIQLPSEATLPHCSLIKIILYSRVVGQRSHGVIGRYTEATTHDGRSPMCATLRPKALASSSPSGPLGSRSKCKTCRPNHASIWRQPRQRRVRRVGMSDVEKGKTRRVARTWWGQ